MKNTGEMTGTEPIRLDIWLWAARFFRTRALAKQAIEGGKVKIADVRAKPAKLMRIGEHLQITRGQELWEVEILDLCAQRGPASVAQQCYRETEASRTTRLAAAEQRRLTAAGYSKPPGKPDKRARRLIQALGDIDAF